MDQPSIASIGQRFLAGLIDSLVLLPLGYLLLRVQAGSRTMALLLAFPMLAMSFFYTIWFHGRFGQTVGKMIAKIRVVAVDGSPLGWSRAFRRSAVDLAIGLAATVFEVRSLVAISDEGYLAVVRSHGGIYMASGAETLGWIANVWAWSEILVALTNPRRRAVHDFIAGTVVVTSPARARPAS